VVSSFSRRVPDAIRLLATSGVDGEVHVERRYAGHSMHTVDDDLQQCAHHERSYPVNR